MSLSRVSMSISLIIALLVGSIYLSRCLAVNPPCSGTDGECVAFGPGPPNPYPGYCCVVFGSRLVSAPEGTLKTKIYQTDKNGDPVEDDDQCGTLTGEEFLPGSQQWTCSPVIDENGCGGSYAWPNCTSTY